MQERCSEWSINVLSATTLPESSLHEMPMQLDLNLMFGDCRRWRTWSVRTLDQTGR